MKYSLLSLAGLILYTANLGITHSERPMFTWHHQKKLKGLDLQGSTIRMVELLRYGNSPHLIASTVWNTCNFLSKQNIKSFAIAVPYPEVKTIKLSVDADLNSEEIGFLVNEEFPSHDWLADFKIINSSPPQAQRKVFVVACPKQTIQNQIQTLPVIPQVIDVDLFAIERIFILFLPFFHQIRNLNTVAGLYLSSRFYSFSVFQYKSCVFRDYQPISSSEPTPSSFLKQTLEQYDTIPDRPPLQHVMLMTSFPSTHILISTLQNHFHCTVSFNLPAHVISVPLSQKESDFYQNNADWALACGLALHSFNSR